MLGVPNLATQNFDYSCSGHFIFYNAGKCVFLCAQNFSLQNHEFGEDVHSRILDCGDASPIPASVGILAISLHQAVQKDG